MELQLFIVKYPPSTMSFNYVEKLKLKIGRSMFVVVKLYE